MPSLLCLPKDVLLAISWENADLCSIVLTCRWFHQLFTPTLYYEFDEDVSYSSCPEYWTRLLGFLRTLRNNALLASYVHAFSLELPSLDLEDWNHERFRLVASKLGLSPEFNVTALPETMADQGEPGISSEEAEESSSSGRSQHVDSAGRCYHDDKFLTDLLHAILSKLPQLRHMDLDYNEDLRLFERTPHFRCLVDVKIGPRWRYDGCTGNNLFGDALRLLSSPQLKSWSLNCNAVEFSSVRCIPPGSSGVRDMEVCCPHVAAKDFDYLLSIPRSLKTFRWTGKA